MSSALPDLAVDRVHLWRGERHVLKGVSVDLHAGELVHVSGPNGAGKTSLLRVVTGLLRPEQGTVSWRGTPIARDPADYQRYLAYASHEAALKSDLTAIENLRFTVGLRRHASAGDLVGFLERTGVAGCRDLPARVLSAGQRRRVAMARVLAVGAALWVLDEPYTNLDAAGAELMSALLVDHLAGGGLALVVAHHDIAVAAHIRRLELRG